MKYLKIFKKIKTLIKNTKKEGGENLAYSQDYAYSKYRKKLLGIA